MLSIAVYKEEFRRRQERQLAERERARQNTLTVTILKLREIGRRHAASVSRFFVFGSLIYPGRFGSNSDIDVAVEWQQKGDYFGLWREIEEELDCEIDFRELGDNSFSQHVRDRGLIVYESRNHQNAHCGDPR